MSTKLKMLLSWCMVLDALCGGALLLLALVQFSEGKPASAIIRDLSWGTLAVTMAILGFFIPLPDKD